MCMIFQVVASLKCIKSLVKSTENAKDRGKLIFTKNTQMKKKLFKTLRFIIILWVWLIFFWMYVHTSCTYSTLNGYRYHLIFWHSIHRRFWATIWVLGNQSRFPAWVVTSTLSHWTISLGQNNFIISKHDWK